jgi:hypothetical protein
MVLRELNDKHQWSIKDLLYHIVTARPNKKNGVSCLVRAKALSDAIYQREEVVEYLSRASQDIRTVGNSGSIVYEPSIRVKKLDCFINHLILFRFIRSCGIDNNLLGFDHLISWDGTRFHGSDGTRFRCIISSSIR